MSAGSYGEIYDFGALYARAIVATIALVLPPGRASNVRYQHIRHVEERLSNNHHFHIGLSGLLDSRVGVVPLHIVFGSLGWAVAGKFSGSFVGLVMAYSMIHTGPELKGRTINDSAVHTVRRKIMI